MSISSAQLKTAEDLERFWRDPLGHKGNQSSRPANDLMDCLAYCFLLSYTVPHGCVDDDGTLSIVDYHVYRIREKFIEALVAYTGGHVDRESEAGPVYIGEEDHGPQLAVTWSVDTKRRPDDVVFVLTLAGYAEGSTEVWLSRDTLNPLPAVTNETLPDKLKSFERFNNTSYMIVKLWRLASLCQHSALEAVSRVLLATIDVLGDQYNDIELFAKHAAMFHEIQRKAKQSSLLRLRDASR